MKKHLVFTCLLVLLAFSVAEARGNRTGTFAPWKPAAGGGIKYLKGSVTIGNSNALQLDSNGDETADIFSDIAGNFVVGETTSGTTISPLAGVSTTNITVNKSLKTGVSTYYGHNRSVSIDLAAASNHVVQLYGATPTTGVSVYFVNVPTGTNVVEKHSLFFRQPPAGSETSMVVWTGATEHLSGTSPTLSTTNGAIDCYVAVTGLESGTTVYVFQGGDGMR